MSTPPIATESQAGCHRGKNAIITGGSRGIGAAIAQNLASKGANVLLVHQSPSSEKAAIELAQKLATDFHVTAISCRADISTPSGISTILSHAQRLASPVQIDIIINNAACFIAKPMGDISPEDFDKAYRINVLGPLLLVQVCMPYLPNDRSGRIVNMSSVASHMGLSHTTLHAGTKSALECMTRTWARELAERCTVNSIATGYTLTDMLRGAGDEAHEAMKVYSAMTPLAPLRDQDEGDMRKVAEKAGGRAAYPEEVAGVVGMICSSESGWMTGCLLGANGGLLMIG